MTLLIMVIAALLGAPIFAIIAFSALANFHNADISLQVVAIEFFRMAEQPFLVAIPLFTLSGFLLAESNAPSRLVRLTQALMGWMPAGLAIVCLVTCALFTAFTGGSGVTIIALGALLMPALKEAGYLDRFSLGMVTSAGSLGLLFAPSLPLILYGVVSGEPIRDLFIAGIIPGMLMITLLAGYSVWSCRAVKRPLALFSRQEALTSIREAAWEIPLPLVVLGGIYSGFFAISEAAAVMAVYVIIVEVFVLKEVPIPKLPRIMRESSVLVGGILLILGLSLASTNFMIDAGIPQKLLALISQWVSSEFTFLLLLLAFLLVLGAILDIFSALVLMVPLVLPVATEFGINPVHLGILFLATMELGYLTPPVGMNLFISSYRFDRPITAVYMSTIPFFLVMLVSVLMIAFWPQLSLWLLA
jgi:tripartite ATP-independent transporter DctM subunit